MPGIVGFGLVNVDIVAVVPSWERDTKATATHWFVQIGGPVPVALCAAARLGCRAAVFIGSVGIDSEAETVAAELARYGVEASLERASNSPTSRSMVMLDSRDGSRTLANHPGFFATRTFTDSELQQVRGADLLHLDGRDLSASLRLAAEARHHRVPVSLDLGTMRPGREDLFGLCDIIIASKGGGAGAFPERTSPVDQVEGFLDLGVGIAAVTLADQGVVIGTLADGIHHVPAVPVEHPLDTCGAGDTFHGAFLAAYLSGTSVIAAARFACAAVALRIRHYGHNDGLPYRTDLR